MKNSFKWIMLVAVALVSSSAWAVWNPDDQNDLTFNLNFENNPTTTTTVDAAAGLTGTLYDYNTAGFDVWKTGGVRGKYADFNYVNDKGRSSAVNDCNIMVPPSGLPVFEFGDGTAGNENTTFAFWFKTLNISSGSFFRHTFTTDPTIWWEVRTYNGKLNFHHNTNNCLRYETTSLLTSLGVSNNTWHHAALVIDRTTSTSSKMFIDGIEVPTTVTYYNNTDSMNIDSWPAFTSPLKVGSGDRRFDGGLDELRIYKRNLSALDISLLYQYNPSDVNTPTVLLPIPRSTNNSIATDVNWVPATNPSLTAQSVYLGTDPCDSNMAFKKSGTGTLNKVINTDLGGPFAFNTTYYWKVVSTINGVDVNGPKWSFTTGSSIATDPYPADGAEEVPDNNINLQWSAPDANNFDVYFSIHRDMVEANDPNVRIAAGIKDSNYLVADTNKGETYYWKVNGNYPPSTVAVGNIWQFRAEARLIIVNTSDVNVVYSSVDYPALSLTKDANLAGTKIGYLGDDDAAIFDFNSDPNFSRLYNMVVIPQINKTLEDQYYASGKRRTPRPFAIHVNGNFDLKCHIIASGLDATASQSLSSKARGGGHRGSFRLENRAAFSAADMIEIFGPGYGATAVAYSCGAGGGYGGKGGDNGRAGAGSGGKVNGYEQIPVPIGGSAGGWSNNANGGPGGGAVELAADGNITIGSTAKIFVTGGSCPTVDYASGGGAGGSVKILAGGSFTNRGIIDANGGDGGDTSRVGKPTEAGGGGGGGRVAIFYGTTYDVNNSRMTAAGGAVGLADGVPSTSSQSGSVGTILRTNAAPLKPDLPTPVSGNSAAITSGKVTIKWYPGFGAVKNEVYFGTNSASLSLVKTVNGAPANGGVLRAEQSYDANVTDGLTYYWYVKASNSVADVNSDLWSFAAVNDYKLVFNTSDVNDVNFDGVRISALTCRVKDSTGWVTTPVATGTVAADGVTIFDFNGFNYSSNYTITVLPEYAVLYDSKPRRPLAIHVNGDFYFDGRMDISGDDSNGVVTQPKARSGGYRGVRLGRGTGSDVAAGYYTSFARNPWGEYRSGTDTGNRTFYTAASSAYGVFGAGLPNVATAMPTGGGGGYGGIGGDSGRGFWYGAFGGGAPYGDKEIPTPVGGSAGGLSDTIASAAGGGGVEIFATGSITFGSNARIYSEGGSVTAPSGKGGGGGAGGSVRIIAGTTFSNAGVISVNGGIGGSSNAQLNQVGGGGAGGRVSIYYVSGTPTLGTITADGGPAGILTTTGATGYAGAGQDGTIFVSSGSPKKASTPTPRNGNDMVYAAGGSGTITLSWYPGYGAANDEVYCDTSNPPATKVGNTVAAVRGVQSNSTATKAVTAGNTYYMRVKTDGAVYSDVWSFKVVNWQCVDPWYDTLVWDKGPYYDCFVDLEEFVDLGNAWGNGISTWNALRVFADEWLNNTRTP